MGQVFALEQDADAEPFGEAMALGDGRGAPAVVAKEGFVLLVKGGVGPRGAEGGLQLLARGDQRLGKEASPELAEPAVGARLCERGHQLPASSQS